MTLFLNKEIVNNIKEQFETPLFIYDEKLLLKQVNETLNFPSYFNLTVRFAMKSCPNAAILQIFDRSGLHFDASSGYEVMRALAANISPHKISLSSQEFPTNFQELFSRGIEFNACSLHQLELFGKLFPGGSCGVRFNPGLGSGGTEKTNVGGPASSFGVWYELYSEVQRIANQYNINIKRIHTHIGSGSDPVVWQRASGLSLALVEKFPTVEILNLGGGFKVARVETEVSTNLQTVGEPIKEMIKEFYERTGRALQFEIEPGTFLVANAGVLLATIQDIVSTGSDGYNFLKINSGMTEVLRPSLYGAQHPIITYSQNNDNSNESDEKVPYVVVGHCCESGDLISCAPGKPETLSPRLLPRASIGDSLVIGGAGAYCSSMSTKNYNSFPEAAEVLIDSNGEFHLIRRRQQFEQIFQNEIPYQPKI